MKPFAPYRQAALPLDRAVTEPRAKDGDLFGVFAVLWLGSVLRVIVGVQSGEVFGAEASAALIAVCALPLLALGSVRERIRGIKEA